jgi:hypothetical protein
MEVFVTETLGHPRTILSTTSRNSLVFGAKMTV